MDKLLTQWSLEEALNEAITICSKQRKDLEEDGGIVLYRKKDDRYIFMPLRNVNTGTDIAPVLFTADREEYAKHIIPLFKEGWRHYASFHTHPQFLPYPSHIDMNELFPGFPINYIYSGSTHELFKYTWINPHNINEGCIPEKIEEI